MIHIGFKLCFKANAAVVSRVEESEVGFHFFEQLAPEIIVMIAEQARPADLKALRQASPKVHRLCAPAVAKAFVPKLRIGMEERFFKGWEPLRTLLVRLGLHMASGREDIASDLGVPFSLFPLRLENHVSDALDVFNTLKFKEVFLYFGDYAGCYTLDSVLHRVKAAERVHIINRSLQRKQRELHISTLIKMQDVNPELRSLDIIGCELTGAVLVGRLDLLRRLKLYNVTSRLGVLDFVCLLPKLRELYMVKCLREKQDTENGVISYVYGGEPPTEVLRRSCLETLVVGKYLISPREALLLAGLPELRKLSFNEADFQELKFNDFIRKFISVQSLCLRNCNADWDSLAQAPDVYDALKELDIRDNIIGDRHLADICRMFRGLESLAFGGLDTGVAYTAQALRHLGVLKGLRTLDIIPVPQAPLATSLRAVGEGLPQLHELTLRAKRVLPPLGTYSGNLAAIQSLKQLHLLRIDIGLVKQTVSRLPDFDDLLPCKVNKIFGYSK